MLIAGLQKTTLVDYPGRVAATVFLQGCNFRCGFCHNPEIVLPHHFEKTIPEGEFFHFLESRLGKIQGVCITGGEPLLWKDTGKFISHIKALGFDVKLDTNGSYPDRLHEIIEEGDVDYIAMDIKSPWHKYTLVTNSKLKSQMSKFQLNNQIPTLAEPHQKASKRIGTMNRSEDSSDNESELISNIRKSISLIMSSNVDYEFRTTVAKPLHKIEDFADIGKMIKGAKRYFIQNFVKSKHINENAGFMPFTPRELKLAQAAIAPFVGTIGVR